MNTPKESVEVALTSQYPSVLRRLSHHDDVVIRNCVAMNIYTPADVLDRLSDDKHWNVRYWVARHVFSHVTTLNKLVNDTCESVKNAAVKNPNYSL